MGDKYDMEAVALSRHSSSIDVAHGDLTQLIRNFEDSVLPLVKTFSGQGKEAFNRFHALTDEKGHNLNASLLSVQEGTQGQDVAWQTGDVDMSDVFTTRSNIVDAGPTRA